MSEEYSIGSLANLIADHSGSKKKILNNSMKSSNSLENIVMKRKWKKMKGMKEKKEERKKSDGNPIDVYEDIIEESNSKDFEIDIIDDTTKTKKQKKMKAKKSSLFVQSSDSDMGYLKMDNGDEQEIDVFSLIKKQKKEQAKKIALFARSSDNNEGEVYYDSDIGYLETNNRNEEERNGGAVTKKQKKKVKKGKLLLQCNENNEEQGDSVIGRQETNNEYDDQHEAEEDTNQDLVKVQKEKGAKKRARFVQSNDSNKEEVPQNSDIEDVEKKESSTKVGKKVRKPFKVTNMEDETDRENRTVFVGNLPIHTTKMKIKRWFSKFGAVETVRLRCAPLSDVRVPKKIAVIKKKFHPDRTNIHAFIRFAQAKDAEKALAANGTLFGETHHIRVDLSTNAGKHDYKKAVFIGNLYFGAEEENLRQLFKVCGEISNIRVVRDHKTGVGKGFAFINFESEDSVELALQLDGQPLGNREIRVTRCMNKTPKAANKTPSNKESALQRLEMKKSVNKAEVLTNFQGQTSITSQNKKKKKKSKVEIKKKAVRNILAGNLKAGSKKFKKSEGRLP